MKNKSKIILLITIFVIFILSIVVFFLYKLKKFENKIYFNVWFFQIKEKNEIGKLLKWSDLELSIQFDDSDKYKINEKEYIELQDVIARFEYSEKDKTLKVYLDIWDPRTKKVVEFKNLPKKISKSICENIIIILLKNNFSIIGEKDINIINEFIEYINFYFMVSPEEIEAGFPVGGIIYKKNKDKNWFDFYKSFNLIACSSYEYQFVKKSGDCINL